MSHSEQRSVSHPITTVIF